MVAYSNFTDPKSGALNMGRNLKTAIVPFKGNSFEDAYVVSESAAKKLTTERLYGMDKDARNGITISRNKYISAFGDKFKKEQLENIDKDGIVKPGTILHKGDPIILATGPKLLSAEDAELGNLHKVLRNTFRDESVTWNHVYPGEVTDVAMTTRGAKVNVKAAAPAEVGDKLANSAASKGVIGKVVPDDEMPKDPKTGEPYEMLLNPMVVLSRVAPNQIVEMQLAKIAKKTGKPYVLPSEPPPEGWAEFARKELEKHGLSETNDVYDPTSGKTIKSLGDGHMYISAFHHLSEKKLCLTEDTEVKTADGWKKITDITAEDLVLTFNPATEQEEYHHPTAVNVYKVDGEDLARLETDYQDLTGTMDHKFILGEKAPVLGVTGAELLKYGG